MSLVIPHIPDLKLAPKDSKNTYLIKNLIEACKEVIYSDFNDNNAIIYVNKKVKLSKPLTPKQYEHIKEYVTSGSYYKYKLAENLESGMIETHVVNIDTLKKCIQIARKTLMMKDLGNSIKGHNLSIYDIHATTKILEVTNNLVNNMNNVQQYTPSLMKLQMEIDNIRGNLIHNGNGHNGNGKSNIDQNTNISLDHGNGHSGNGSNSQKNIGHDNIKYDTKHEESVHESINPITDARVIKSEEQRQVQGSDTSGLSSGEGEELYIRDRFGEETGIIKPPSNTDLKSSNSVTNGESSEQDKNLNGGIGKPTNRVF